MRSASRRWAHIHSRVQSSLQLALHATCMSGNTPAACSQQRSSQSGHTTQTHAACLPRLPACGPARPPDYPPACPPARPVTLTGAVTRSAPSMQHWMLQMSDTALSTAASASPGSDLPGWHPLAQSSTPLPDCNAKPPPPTAHKVTLPQAACAPAATASTSGIWLCSQKSTPWQRGSYTWGLWDAASKTCSPAQQQTWHSCLRTLFRECVLGSLNVCMH